MLSSTGRLVSVPWGRRCRWMSLHCQLYICLCWNWCLHPLWAALVRFLLGPLERFLSLHRWGIAGYLGAGLSLWLIVPHLDWTGDLWFGALAGIGLGFWWIIRPALRTPERLS